MKFIDLFCGVGGFRMGFENAGFDCVFSSEIDAAARAVYETRFGECPSGDISEIEAKDIPPFDIMLGGFPCQPFSIAGHQRGFDDTRGTLFFEICRIAAYHRPKVIVLENVKNMVHHDKGRTMSVITDRLRDLGYCVSHKLLNATRFGVPQNRERIFIIATMGWHFDFDDLVETQAPPLREFLGDGVGSEVLDPSEYTLIDSPTVQPSGLVFVGYRNKNLRTVGIRPNTEHLSRIHRQPNRIYSADGVHPTLSAQETSGRYFVLTPETGTVRKLTLDECYRLMGFPGDFPRARSASESYKQIGNSVCVPLIEELARSVGRQIKAPGATGFSATNPLRRVPT